LLFLKSNSFLFCHHDHYYTVILKTSRTEIFLDFRSAKKNLNAFAFRVLSSVLTVVQNISVRTAICDLLQHNLWSHLNLCCILMMTALQLVLHLQRWKLQSLRWVECGGLGSPGCYIRWLILSHAVSIVPGHYHAGAPSLSAYILGQFRWIAFHRWVNIHLSCTMLCRKNKDFQDQLPFART